MNEQGQDQQLPPLPALRTFAIRRWDPDAALDAEPSLQTVIVSGHILQQGTNGGLFVVEHTVDPVIGPVAFVRRGFNEWYDFEEVMIPPSMRSPLHLVQ